MDYLKIEDEIYEKIYSLNNIDATKFKGSVLYLGLGKCILPKFHTDKVTKTTIVEIDNDVINSVEVPEEYIIINSDAYEFNTEEKFDIILIDIWYQPVDKEVVDNIVEKYDNYLTETGKVLYLKSIIK